jgi:hypothetical protein
MHSEREILEKEVNMTPDTFTCLQKLVYKQDLENGKMLKPWPAWSAVPTK